MKKFLVKYYNKPVVKSIFPKKVNFKLYYYVRSDLLVSIYLFKYLRLFTLTFGDFDRFVQYIGFSFRFVSIGDFDIDYVRFRRKKIGL